MVEPMQKVFHAFEEASVGSPSSGFACVSVGGFCHWLGVYMVVKDIRFYWSCAGTSLPAAILQRYG